MEILRLIMKVMIKLLQFPEKQKIINQENKQGKYIKMKIIIKIILIKIKIKLKLILIKYLNL